MGKEKGLLGSCEVHAERSIAPTLVSQQEEKPCPTARLSISDGVSVVPELKQIASTAANLEAPSECEQSH